MLKIIKIDDSKLQEIIKWKPHAKQQEVLDSFDLGKKFIVLCAGRRFGKSALCAYLVLRVLLTPNKKIWIVSPTYDLSMKVFTYLTRWFFLVAPSQRKAMTYRPTPKIQTTKGSIVECKSAENPVSLIGEELDLLIVDEAARISRDVWERNLFATLASRKGKAVFISTPLGRNWFYKEFEKAKEGNAAFRFESREGVGISDEEWKIAKENLPEDVFNQEYKAMFLDEASSVFRRIEDIINENCLADAKNDHTYVLGVDLGKYHDFTVLTVIDKYNNNVVYLDRFNDLDWNMQKNRIVAAAKRYNNARIIIDSTGTGDPITDDLRLQGLVIDDFKYYTKSKQQLINKLQIFIEQKLIHIPNNERLVDELKTFGYNITEAGRMIFGAPQGLYDDMVNSLALAVWGLAGSATPRTALQEELSKVIAHKRESFI